MCAIFGIIGEYCPKKARDSLALLSHRGPDHCGIWEKKGIFLAHHRLSIVDLSMAGSQPMQDDNIVISFNGEIYNHRALREVLDYPFKGESDTEVILAAYKRWGLDFIDQIEGMFALALYVDDTLYLFRDRLGKKPLYYLQSEEGFVFASEIKALKPYLRTKTLNMDALHAYLSFLAPVAPDTFYTGIKKLESAQMGCYKNGSLHVKSYYTPFNKHKKIVNHEDALVQIKRDIEKAVETRLIADVPVGMLLSGGVDSSLLTAIAREKKPNIQTFSLGYDSYKKYDETNYAREVSDYLGVENIRVSMSSAEFMGSIDEVIHAFDEPINDPAAVSLNHLFKRIKKEQVKVVLSGEGADELFLGYKHYNEYLNLETIANMNNKQWMRKHLLTHKSDHREWEWHKRVFSDELLFRSAGEKFTDLQQNDLFNKTIKDGQSVTYIQRYRDEFIQLTQGSVTRDESFWYSYCDLKQFQAEHFLTKLDRISMAHSIEARTPFLDQKVVNTVFALHPSLRYGDKSITKPLLKSLAHNYLPEASVNRKKKGFSSPYIEVLNEYNALNKIILVNKKSGLFKEKTLVKYVNSGKSGAYKQHIWGLYLFSLWFDKEFL